MGLTLLLPSTSSSSSDGAGSSLRPGYEYQDLLFTVSGSPASAVYGKLGLSFLGSTATLDMTSGLPSAAAALGTLESAWGSGNVEASAVNKGYRLKFVGDLAQYDIQEATLTPSTSYTLNTGTGTPSKASQRGYTAGVTGSAEVVTLQLTPNDPGQNGQVSDSLGNEVNYDGGLTQYTTQNNVGFAVTSGSGTGTVEFTAGSNGPKGATGPVFNNNNTSISPFSVTPGVADVAEVLGQCIISYSGAAGYFTFSDGFSAIAIPVTLSGSDIKDILNGATAYNASKVDTVTVGASTITIDYASGESPAGTITVGGKTGAAVTAAIDTIQDGANFYLLSLPWDVVFKPNSQYYSDNGTTPAVDGATVQLARNLMNAGASLNLSQSVSGSRMTYRVGANGKAWLEGDGSKYYSELDPIPCTGGLASFHLIKFTQAGYYNLFEEHLVQLPREWIDTASDIEPNGVTAIPGYDDNSWHTLITFTGPTGNARTKVWVDGVLKTNVASGTIGTNKRINQFNRFNNSCWKGGVGYFGFGSFDPTAYIAGIHAELTAEIAT